MKILKLLYNFTGPVSRMLQGVAIDLATAAALLSDCKKFEDARANADLLWDELIEESVAFANQHGVDTEFHTERNRKKKKLAGEKSSDERLTGKECLKIDTFLVVLDEVSQQLYSRFGEHNVALLKQMSLFTPAGLLSSSNDDLNSDAIRKLCDQYELCAEEVQRELVDFRTTYRVCSQVTQQGKNLH